MNATESQPQQAPETVPEIVHELWCEWDIGQEGLLFRSPEAAMKWARANPLVTDTDDGPTSADDLVADGLMGIRSWTIQP